MATSRTQQSHMKRVEQIAEEAAAKIAADSPLEEDVIVTIEEVPPTSERHAEDRARHDAGPAGRPAVRADAVPRDAGCPRRGECGVCPRDIRRADEVRGKTRGGPSSRTR